MVRNEGINSIVCIETEPIRIKTSKNNLQPYLSSRPLLFDQNILNDTKNRAEKTYLNIFLRLKSGHFGSEFTGLCRCVCCGIKVPVENLNIAFTVEPGNIAHIRDFKHSLTFGLIFHKILRQNVLKIILVHSEGSVKQIMQEIVSKR